VLDVERGVVDEIEPQPFQTDTCIGDWHYNRDAVYKRPKTVIDLLVDIVSRNGNLLLNIPLPASGMPDDAELKILASITAWMKVNSDAIYATRPWKIFGEGPGIRKTPPGSGFAGTSRALQREQTRRPHRRGHSFHDQGRQALRLCDGLESARDTHQGARAVAPAWNSARSRASNCSARMTR
jgi:alpha-L-fucosidase